jgi:hypothetical protein
VQLATTHDHTDREHDEMMIVNRRRAATAVLLDMLDLVGPVPMYFTIRPEGSIDVRTHTEGKLTDHQIGVRVAAALGLSFDHYALTTYVHDEYSGKVDGIVVTLSALTKFDGWPPVNLGQVPDDFKLLACDWVEADGTVSCTDPAHRAEHERQYHAEVHGIDLPPSPTCLCGQPAGHTGNARCVWVAR